MNAETRERLETILEQVKTRPSEDLESDTVEFKVYSSENAMHGANELTNEITAFANTRGGIIIIGVLDNTNVVHGQWETQLDGFDEIDTIRTRERILGRINPAIPLEVDNYIFEGKNYAVITVPRIRHSLVGSRSGKYCRRQGRSSIPMTPEEVIRAVQALQTYDWSAQDTDANLDDLDDESLEAALNWYAQQRGMVESPSRESFLEAVGVTRNGRVTKGGLLFLGRMERIRDLLGTFEYRFTWRQPNGDLKVNDVWQGSLWVAIERASGHFASCNDVFNFTFQDVEYDAPLLDEMAFHEAFLNAIVHRDYAADGMIAVDFSGHEIAITSPGNFYGGVTAQNIAKHEPRHRNGALAQTLMNFGFVDRAGVGVQRMGLSSLRYGRRFPEFYEIDNSVKVTMQASYCRPGVFVIAVENKDTYTVPTLLLLNAAYETGAIPVREAEALIKSTTRTTDDSWTLLRRAVENTNVLEIGATRDGAFVYVPREWAGAMDVTKVLEIPTGGPRYLLLYSFLRNNERASNRELTPYLGYENRDQTTRLLGRATFVRSNGRGAGARWTLNDDD